MSVPNAWTLTDSERVRRIYAVMHNPRLSAVQKCIYVGLTVTADEHGEIRAPVSQMQVFAGAKDPHTVHRATREMFGADDCIESTKQRGRVTTYQLLRHRVESSISEARERLKTTAQKPPYPTPTGQQKAGGRNHSGLPSVNSVPRARIDTPFGSNSTYQVGSEEKLPTSNVATQLPREVATRPKIDLDQLSDRLLAACNGALDNPVNCQGLLSMNIPLMWLNEGADLERDVLPTLHAAGKKFHGKRIRTWGYFSGMISDAKAARERGLPAPNIGGKPAIPETIFNPSDNREFEETLRRTREINAQLDEELMR